MHNWLIKRPRWHLHFTPTSASWLNMVEGRFALLTRCCLQRGTFQSTDALEAAIAACIEHTNAEPRPFTWTKPADTVLATVGRFCRQTSYSDHEHGADRFRSSRSRALNNSMSPFCYGLPCIIHAVVTPTTAIQSCTGLAMEIAIPFRSGCGPARCANNAKSRIRAHVEHVFAEQKTRIGLFIRTVGLSRATTKIGLANLVYNLKRLFTLRRAVPA